MSGLAVASAGWEQRSHSAYSAQPKQVICVCGGYGFPSGSASAARITMVGKALQAAGFKFHVLHCGPSPVAVNRRRAGVCDGISFEYTTWLARPRNRLARALVYLRAVAGLTLRLLRLRPDRRRTAVYLYVMTGPLNFYVGWLCRLIGLPLVQELCEWWPGEPTCSAFTRWLYRGRLFRAATGVLAISNVIENRAREQAAAARTKLLIHRLPAVLDVRRFANGPAARPGSDFVWCGYGWLKDILFLIRALALVKRSGYRCRLVIVGSHPAESRQVAFQRAADSGLSAADVFFTGWVGERDLAAWYKSAAALLLPLWADDRSITRMPNKLGEYLASGRPVIASNVGELTSFLVDRVNAYLAEPGSESDFADRMKEVLQHPEEAARIGAAGQRASAIHLDYRVHAGGLGDFFQACIRREGG